MKQQHRIYAVIAALLMLVVGVFVGQLCRNLIKQQNDNNNIAKIVPVMYMDYDSEPLMPAPSISESISIEPIPVDYRIVGSTELTVKINEQRTAAGLSELVESAILNNQACTRAQYLVDNSIWSHAGWISFINRDIFKGKIGENLARNFESSADMVQAWMNSESHKAVIMDGSFTHHGWCLVDKIVVSHFAQVY